MGHVHHMTGDISFIYLSLEDEYYLHILWEEQVSKSYIVHTAIE